MKIIDFIGQRKIVPYNQKEHLSALHQFLFLLKEAKFSDEDLKTTIPFSYNRNLPPSTLDPKFIFLRKDIIAQKNFRNFSQEYAQTHIGIEAIRAARDSFSAIYPFNKLKKNATAEEVKNIENNVHAITRPFFEIMNFISHLDMPDSKTFVMNGHFGSNMYASYHENLVLLAMHNYSQFNIQEFSELIDKVVPDNSLTNQNFLTLLASILYNDEKIPLMDVVFKKLGKDLFTQASLSQTKNHRVFFNGLKSLVNNNDAHLFLNKFNDVEKTNFLNELFSNLANIGMINNGYYCKTFTAEDKLKMSKFIESLDKNNNFIYDLAHSFRYQNIDFEALVSSPIIFNSKLIALLLHQSHGAKKSNISYLLDYLAPEDKISFVEVGNNLSSLKQETLDASVSTINKYFNQQNILEMMNSDHRLFKALESTYRSKILQKTLDEKSQESNRETRIRNKI